MDQHPISPLNVDSPERIETVPAESAAEDSRNLDDPKETQRLSRLLWVFGLLFAVLVVPSVAGRVQYAITAAKERAEYDVARENHQDLNLNQISTSSRLLAQYVGPSVVNVRARHGHAQGQGSGVIIDTEGYILTNAHVVRGANMVEVQLSDGRRGPASVVGRDPLVDMAVLKTELRDLVAADWGDSDELAVGEMVWAIGSPFGLQKSITFGILSAKERRGIAPQDPSYDPTYQEFLQTDAAVNPGNSGGPLVNSEGKVVGINTAIIGESYRGISFSIPSTIARESYELLRKEGFVHRGMLGVQPSKVPDSVSRRYELERDEGVFVAQVYNNTPAEDAGMQRGDVILSWNGAAYSDPTLMSRAIAATPIGSEVSVEVVRKGSDGPKHLTLNVTVAARPRTDSL